VTGPTERGEVIEVPWRVLPDYRCFGCSPSNDRGLQLQFTRTDDGIECTFELDRTFESYPGVVHGGISGTVCDETMGNLLVLRTGFSVFTVSLRTRYVAPLSIGASYRCVATTAVSAGATGLCQAHAEIIDSEGGPVVFATGTYRPVTSEQARSRMGLSDRETELIEQALAELRTTTRGEGSDG
jgi:acyl-coenzyme A thioesterase PaaI-like protein